MFQGLTQGATVSLFYKNEPRVENGRVIAVNTHIPTYNPNQPMAMFNGPVTDITVQVGNDTIPFSGLPASGVVADFPDKGLTRRTAVGEMTFRARDWHGGQLLEKWLSGQGTDMADSCWRIIL